MTRVTNIWTGSDSRNRIWVLSLVLLKDPHGPGFFSSLLLSGMLVVPLGFTPVFYSPQHL